MVYSVAWGKLIHEKNQKQRNILQSLFFAYLLRKNAFYAVGEDAEPCLAHSPTALNELNLAVAPL